LKGLIIMSNNVASFVFASSVKFVTVEDLDSTGEVVNVVKIDQDATIAAFLAQLSVWDEDRVNGASRMKDAIAATLACSVDDKGNQVGVPTPQLAMMAAMRLVADPMDSVQLKEATERVKNFIGENATDEVALMADKLYYTAKGKGGGTRAVTPALILLLRERDEKAAAKAAKKADAKL
jgi:hypothetical protein